jgi:hypothetical protein
MNVDCFAHPFPTLGGVWLATLRTKKAQFKKKKKIQKKFVIVFVTLVSVVLLIEVGILNTSMISSSLIVNLRCADKSSYWINDSETGLFYSWLSIHKGALKTYFFQQQIIISVIKEFYIIIFFLLKLKSRICF